MNWNKGNSLAKNKLETIEILLEQNTPDLLCLQELNIRQNEDLKTFQMDGYTLITDSMLEEHGLARTGIYIKQNIKFKRRSDLEIKGDSMIWLTIYPFRQKSFNICNYYRQWQIVSINGKITNTDSIISQGIRLQKYTEKVIQAMGESETICCQDSNIDFSLDWNNPYKLDKYEASLSPIYKIFKNELLNKGMAFIKTEPTKIYHDKPNTAIDHMLTTNPAKIISHTVIKGAYSDHYPVVFTRLAKEKTNFPNYYLSRDYSAINWDEMNSLILQDPQYINILKSNDPDFVAEMIIHIINKNLEIKAPLKKIQNKISLPKFSTADTRQLILQSDDALRKLKETNDIKDLRNFRHIRNNTHKQIKKDKENDIKNKLKAAEDSRNDQKIWDTTKKVIGWKKFNVPKLLVMNGKTITKTHEIVNTINREQILRNIKLRREIIKTNTNPMTNYLKATKHIKNKLQLQQINMTQLQKTINDIKPSGSTSNDSISTRTLKNLQKTINPLILNLTNTIIANEQYPDCLKILKAVLILKNGKPPTDPLSYRAVNILPALGKIVDRIVAEQITNFLINNDVIPNQHHGGIKKKSTVTAIMSVIDDWSERMENGEDLAIIVINQSAAYDTIDHGILIHKMEAVGFNKSTLKYFKSYLKN